MHRIFLKLGTTVVLILVLIYAAMAQLHAPPLVMPDRTGMTNVGAVSMPSVIKGLYSAAIDSSTGFAYVASSHSPILSKVDVRGALPKVVAGGTPNLVPNDVGALWELMVDSSDPDPAKHYVYAASNNMIFKMAPGDAAHAPQVVATLQLTSLKIGLSGVIDTSSPDPALHYAYFTGTADKQAKILRVRLSDFSEQGVKSLQMGSAWAAGIDTMHHYAYFANSRQIAKVNLATFKDGGPSVAVYALDSTTPGDGFAREGFDVPGFNVGFVVDEIHGYGYIGTANTANGADRAKADTWPYNQAMVVRVNLGTGDAFPAHPVEVLNLRVGERQLSAGVIDVKHGNVYFATDNTYPAHVYMVHVGDGTKPMHEVGRLDLKLGSSLEEFPPDGPTIPGVPAAKGELFIRSAVIDVKRNAIYLGTDTRPGQVVKVGINGKK